MTLYINHKILISGQTIGSQNNITICSYDLSTALAGANLTNVTLTFDCKIQILENDTSPRRATFNWFQFNAKRLGSTITIGPGQFNTIAAPSDITGFSTLGFAAVASGNLVLLQVSPSAMAGGATLEYGGYLRVICTF